jgi:hypothetical protein
VIRRFLFVVVASVLFAGCVPQPDLTALKAQPITVARFNNGRRMSERRIEPPSREHDLLEAWATEHKNGWSWSVDTYAPGMSMVHGTNFTLNILKNRVILNINGRQYVHGAKSSEFSFLSEP